MPELFMRHLMRVDFRPKSSHAHEQTIYCDPAASVSHDFIDELMVKTFVHAEDWKQLPKPLQERMIACQDRRKILEMMVDHRLLTDYQSARIAAGTTFGLVLGNYRILRRLGAGGMAVVFEA